MTGKINYVPKSLEEEAIRIMKEVREATGMPCSKADAYKIIVSKSQMIKVPITSKILKQFLLGEKKWIKEEIYNQY